MDGAARRAQAGAAGCSHLRHPPKTPGALARKAPATRLFQLPLQGVAASRATASLISSSQLSRESPASLGSANHRQQGCWRFAGQVWLATRRVRLWPAELENGDRIEGESSIGQATADSCGWADPRAAPALPRAMFEAIANAELIVLGPAALHLAVCPICCAGTVQAIRRSPGSPPLQSAT